MSEPNAENKAVSFRVDEDFKINVGKEKKLVNVPRLSWRNSSKVYDEIFQGVVEDRVFQLDVLKESKDVEVNVMEKDPLKGIKKLLRERLPEILKKSNITKIKNILHAISEGAIDDGIMKLMQFSEAIEVLNYLIDQNFGSLKNLEASLKVMTSSERQ